MNDDHLTEPATTQPAVTGHRRSEKPAARGRGRSRPVSPTRVSLEIGITSVIIGVLFGVAWYVLSPDITGEVAENGVAVPIAEARQIFDLVAVFSLLGVGIGLVLGVFFGIRHRRRPVTAVLALAVGGLGGSLLALGIGILFGPSVGNQEVGTEVDLPLELEAPAALFAWPLVAVVVVTIMSLFRDDRSPWVWNGRRSGANLR